MSKPKRLTLCSFMDGFGWKILNEHSFLEGVAQTKAPVETILGYSCTCVPTILTGKLPQVHGHLSFFYYDPKNSPFGPLKILGLIPKFITSRGRLRSIISRFLKKIYRYTGYFEIYNIPFKFIHHFNYSEKHDIYERGGFENGTTTIFDYLRDNNIPFHMSDWRASEQSNIDACKEAVKKGDARFAYLYLPGLDGVLHEHGTQAQPVDQKIAWYDKNVREIMELAKEHYDEVNLYIFSDHGMHDIKETCDLMGQIESLGLKFGEDYSAVYDSTMARFWFLKDGAREKIVDKLKEEKRGKILSEEELEGYGCHFKDKKYGDLFYVMNGHVLICPSFMGESPLAGMHGYLPEEEDATAMFVSNQKIENTPKRLDNLYSLMVEDVNR